jgi:hypothetical protein
MKNLFGKIVLMVAAYFAVGCTPFNENCVAICGEDKVWIVDFSKSEGNQRKDVWFWQANSSVKGLPAEYINRLQSIDECKAVDNNSKMLITSSSDCCLLIDIPTKEVLFYANVVNAHSAEMLPNGRIAIALSINNRGYGNALELYDISAPEKCIFRDSLYSGHGVVWNEKRESLFALGYKELREYKLKDWQSTTPSLEKVAEWTLPINSGHDLSPVDDNRMLISGREGVVWFDIEKQEFAPFEPLKDVRGVKSVNLDPKTNRLIFTKGETSWWTQNIYQRNPDKTVTIDSMKLYKARPLKF